MTRFSIATVAALCLAAPVAPAADPPRVVRKNIEWLDVWVTDAGLEHPKGLTEYRLGLSDRG